MRHETAGVTEILLDNAKNEFLEYGFHEASLRRIATKVVSAPIPYILDFMTRQGFLVLL